MIIDLSKAFKTVDHQISLKRPEYYGIAGNNLRWFGNYLKEWKRFISFEHNSTKKVTETCGVPPGSILGPLMFLLYVDDLHHASKLLNLIMFTDNSNLLFSHRHRLVSCTVTLLSLFLLTLFWGYIMRICDCGQSWNKVIWIVVFILIDYIWIGFVSIQIRSLLLMEI